MEDRMYDHSSGETENPMGDRWKGLRKIAEEVSCFPDYVVEKILAREFGPLLDAAETATEICDEDDNCKACQLRDALEKFK